jgi:hypothetical protein
MILYTSDSYRCEIVDGNHKRLHRDEYRDILQVCQERKEGGKDGIDE